MEVKLGLLLLLLIVYSQKVKGRCGNSLTKDETECATPLNLDSRSILKMYRSDSNDPKFEEYTNCVWLKWNYVDQNEIILYDNLTKSNSLAWQMSRICHDVYQYLLQMRIDFKEAAKYCEQNRPPVENPITVRRCVAKNYKQSPVDLEITELD